MHDVVKFYSVSLVALISASIALSQFVFEDNDSNVPLWGLLGLLWGVFALVGFLELYYYVELRIRKIKMVEQIAAIRNSYIEAYGGLDKILRLIPSVVKSPPFLRRPSAEWYSVLYFSFANAAVVAFSLFSVHREFSFLPELGSPKTLPAVVLCAVSLGFLSLQFYAITALAHVEDLKREREVGESEYDLFAHNEVPFPFGVLNWAAQNIETLTRCKYEKRNR